MFNNKVVSAAAVALAAVQFASAQTSTSCNPMDKTTCPADPALGIENPITIDFTQGESDFFTAEAGTAVKYTSNGAEFTINKGTDAPTIVSNKYIFFGRVDLEVIAAPGAGIITSIVLESDDLDEIDWEWVGSDDTQVQTDYFGKGDTGSYNRGGFSSVDSPTTTVHTYSIDWTSERIEWLIDNTVVRTLEYADAESGTRFPQTPCQIKLGTWDAGAPGEPIGTVQWGGGYTDFSQAPFTAYYKSLKVTDYANGVKNAKEYTWPAGNGGSYQNIKVVTTDGSSTSGSSSSSDSSSTTTASASKTSTGSAKTTVSATTTAKVAASTTLSTATGTGASGSASASSAAATTTTGSDSGSSSTTPASSSAAASSTPTGAAFKTGFSGALVGAGLLAAVAL